MLKTIQFNYDNEDAEYNNKISNLKTIFKLLTQYINEKRKQKYNKDEITKITVSLQNIFLVF